jgi:hypothetical protein
MTRIGIKASRTAAVASIAGVLFAGTAALADDATGRAVQSRQPVSMAQLLRLSGLKDLVACRSAAVRHCDSSGGMNAGSLLRCGATLAAISDQIGSQCRRVLQRYGQLQN